MPANHKPTPGHCFGMPLHAHLSADHPVASLTRATKAVEVEIGLHVPRLMDASYAHHATLDSQQNHNYPCPEPGSPNTHRWKESTAAPCLRSTKSVSPPIVLPSL